jgi:hypothetical protein
MTGLARRLSLLFAAGAVGALANSLAVWGAGELGVARALGVAIEPGLTPAWLYPRIVWGGLWGALFLLPVSRERWVRRGLVLSLGPTLAQLLVVFPLASGKRVFGLELGALTPLLVLVYNAVWGVAASGWLRLTRGG